MNTDDSLNANNDSACELKELQPKLNVFVFIWVNNQFLENKELIQNKELW